MSLDNRIPPEIFAGTFEQLNKLTGMTGMSASITRTYGRKDDGGKLRYDLIPLIGLEELAKVYTVGAGKYGDDNWRGGIQHKRIIAAMFRHLQAWRKGEERHDDDMHHLASVAWGCMALMEYEQTHPDCVERG